MNPGTDGNFSTGIVKSGTFSIGPMDTAGPQPVAPPSGFVPPTVGPIIMTNSPTLQLRPANVPPPPQIAQRLTAIPQGFQFAYNQLMSPTPYRNQIVAYRIYRNTMSNNFSGALLIRTILHDPTHLGSVTVQDTVSGNQTYYYFVTSVDSFKQESSPNSFQSSAVTSKAVLYLGGTTTSTIGSGGTITNPKNAIDGNPATFADIVDTLSSPGTASTSLTISQFPAIVSNTGTPTLAITSQVISGTGILAYSLDGGSTFTNIYSSGSPRAKQTDIVTLSANQSLGLLQVKATAQTTNSSGTTTAEITLYEAQVTVL